MRTPGIIELFARNINPLHISASYAAAKEPDAQTLKAERMHSLQIKMYGSRAFHKERYSFVPSEKMFLVLEFKQLEPGEYNLLALWKSPTGQLVSTSRHTVSLAGAARNHRSFFWLKLMRNGMVTKILTGKAYNRAIHGKWSVEIYINGTGIATQYFMMVN